MSRDELCKPTLSAHNLKNQLLKNEQLNLPEKTQGLSGKSYPSTRGNSPNGKAARRYAYLQATGHVHEPLIIPARRPPWGLAVVLAGVLLAVALALLVAAVVS